MINDQGKERTTEAPEDGSFFIPPKYLITDPITKN